MLDHDLSDEARQHRQGTMKAKPEQSVGCQRKDKGNWITTESPGDAGIPQPMQRAAQSMDLVV